MKIIKHSVRHVGITTHGLFKRRPHLIVILPIISILLCLSVIYAQYVSIMYPKHTRDIPRVGQISAVLSVLAIRPTNTTILPEKITFTFSEAVDPHIFEHYFYISPETPGRIEQGAIPEELTFIPTVPFSKGTTYSVKVTAGLPSLLGRKLLQDEFGSFSTPVIKNNVQFIREGIYGRVFSNTNQQPLGLTLEGLSDELVVGIYRSDQAHLLNYLVYDRDADDEQYYSSWSGDYVNDSSHHASSLLAKKVVMKTGDELKNLQLPAGVYYLDAKSADFTESYGSVFVVVNSVGVTLRQDDKKVTLSAFNLQTNKLLSSEARVGFYSLKGQPLMLAQHTFREIESAFFIPFSSKVDAVVGSVGGETVFIPLRLPNSLADINVNADLDKQVQIFLYTDRPIYKPGDTVYYRGIARQDGDSLYRLPQELPIRVWMGYGEKPAIEQVVTTDAHGVFSGEFIAPSGTDYTQYLYASADLNKENSYGSDYAYFDIVNYVKPEFELKTQVKEDDYLKSEKLSFTISGNYFSGKPLANENVEYSVHAQDFYEAEKAVYNANFNITEFGGMCGGGFGAFEEYYGTEIETKTVRFDANGTTELTFTLPEKYTSSQTITLVAKKTDSKNNQLVSAVKTVVHAGEFNIFFMPSAQSYTMDDEVVVPFYAEKLSGEKVSNTEFTYKFVKTNYYYSGSDSNTTESKLLSGSVTTDGQGKGVISFRLADLKDEKLNELSKYVVIEAKDSHDNTVQNRKYITIQTKEQQEQEKYNFWSRGSIEQTYLKITSAKNSFLVGDEISLDVVSPKDLDVLLSLERGRIYHPVIAHLKKGHNDVSIRVGQELSPSISIVFSFFADGSYKSEGVVLNVPAMHKLLQVSVQSDKKTYDANDTANIKVTTKDASGEPVSVQLSLSIVDKAIYGLRKNATPPLHSSLYYFRPRRTNASSSLTWVGTYGGGGGGGGGGGDMMPGNTVDTLYWNPRLTTDVTGELNVAVPLKGYATIWKALVLAASDTTDVGQAETEFLSR